MAKKSLKFGINPLFGGPSLAARAKTGSPYREIALSEIDVDPDQPRRVFDDKALDELSQSIREHGVLAPVLVQLLEGGTYRLIAGERRFRAAKLAGLEAVPAVVVQGDSLTSDTLSKQLVENLQRADLTPMERALAIGQLKERFNLSIRDIAAKLGISKGLVQRSVEILALPDDLQSALIKGAPESKVLMLAQVEDKAQRKKLLGQIEKLSRDDLDLEVYELLENQGKRAGKGVKVYRGGTVEKNNKRKARLSVEDRRIIEEIQRTLGTKIYLKRGRGKNGKGKLILEFYTASDLYEIYRRLTA